MRLVVLFVLSMSVICGLPTQVCAQKEFTVVASVKPIHSLVSGVMRGVGRPLLILEGGNSPHGYSLKPSIAQALQRAGVLFWVGPELETFLQGAVKTLPKSAVIVQLSKAKGLTRLAYREGGPWAGHGDDKKIGTAKYEHDSHKFHKSHNARDMHEHDNAGGEVDMHFWLDPSNAKVFVKTIVRTLEKADPTHKDIYRKNGRDLLIRLDKLISTLKDELASVKNKPFIVFHDAYQYFEKRFGLNAVGSITINPDLNPGARRLSEIRKKIKSLDAACIFSEPQFTPKLVRVIVEGTRAKTSVLDPLGADLTDGPDLYFELMKNNAKALKTCLAKSS